MVYEPVVTALLGRFGKVEKDFSVVVEAMGIGAEYLVLAVVGVEPSTV